MGSVLSLTFLTLVSENSFRYKLSLLDRASRFLVFFLLLVLIIDSMFLCGFKIETGRGLLRISGILEAQRYFLRECKREIVQ